MRTAIIITGNVASGKSSLSKRWIEAHPEFEHVVMDEIRMKIALREGFGHFTYQMENEARQVMEDKIRLHENIIFETVGFGAFSQKMETLIGQEFDTVIRFYINIDLKETQLRMLDRQRITGYVPHPEERDMMQYSEKVHHYYRFMNEKGTILPGAQPTEIQYILMLKEVYEQNGR